LIHFISFGQTGHYENLAIDLLNNIKLAYPMSKIKIYNQNDLPVDYVEYAQKHTRGYGYWRWKPYIIFHYLQNVEVNDTVVYLDGRSHFKSKKIEWLEVFNSQQEFELCVLQTKHRESLFTTAEVFKFFNIDIDSFLANSGQIAGGVSALKKNNKTLDLIENWMSILYRETELFNDSYDFHNQKKGFIEHRHDQSAFSLLVKLSKINVFFIYNSDLYKKNSLYIQFMSHNTKHAKFKNKVKRILIFLIGYKLTLIFLSFGNKLSKKLSSFRKLY